ncbi:MAG: hypothetical protein LBK52_05300, partial [Deltaproteobacteria bacterium]|nr:hypothetical protein [Deltaproteobacteria bacterium]
MLAELKNQIYPLGLVPMVSETPWGRRQSSVFAENNSQALWGEIFLAIRDFGLTSKIANGPLAGQPIHRVGQEWERALVNPPGEAGWPLPFTVWLERTGDQPGPVRVKSGPEFWYVLEGDHDSWLGAGLDPAQTQWPQKLKRFLAEPGEACLCPAGVPQAQGPGLTIFKAGLSKIGLETLWNWERRPDAWDYQSAPGYKVPLSQE